MHQMVSLPAGRSPRISLRARRKSPANGSSAIPDPSSEIGIGTSISADIRRITVPGFACPRKAARRRDVLVLQRFDRFGVDDLCPAVSQARWCPGSSSSAICRIEENLRVGIQDAVTSFHTDMDSASRGYCRHRCRVIEPSRPQGSGRAVRSTSDKALPMSPGLELCFMALRSRSPRYWRYRPRRPCVAVRCGSNVAYRASNCRYPVRRGTPK